jgi:hypothetical protein
MGSVGKENLNKENMKTTLILTLIVISGCSKDYRATRKINKLQSWGYLKTDSVTIRDTIQGFDTLIVRQFDTLNHSDTLFVVKDGIKVKTIIRWKDRAIEQEVSKKDTIRETKYIRTTIEKHYKQKWWNKFWIGALTTFLLFVLLIIALNRLTYIK